MPVYRLWCRSVVLLTLAVVFLSSGCTRSSEKQQPGAAAGPGEQTLSKPAAGAIVDNRSRVVATIVESVPLKAPNFRLRLRVEAVEPVEGYASLAQVGDVIDVYPNFVRKEGRALDPGAPENRHMAEARSLKPGDKISAVVYRRDHKTQGSWLLMSWQRR